MTIEHEFLATAPFDLYSLTLFHLVADEGSFTAAGTIAGMTQSAISRRIATMETKLGVTLFLRTTRRVRLSDAGRDLYDSTNRLLGETHSILRTFRESRGLQPPVLRIGIARSIGLSYLPGFFVAYRKKFPRVLLNISQAPSDQLLRSVGDEELDACVISLPRSLPRSLEATHKFTDEFTLVMPPGTSGPGIRPTKSATSSIKLTKGYRWLLFDTRSTLGESVKKWLGRYDEKLDVAMELDSYDLIVNLVSLGVGVALVPHRVLPLYGERRGLDRVNMKPRFTRTIGVVLRRNARRLPHITGFVENVLF